MLIWGIRDRSRRVRKEGDGDGARLLGRKVASLGGPRSELECIVRESDWNLNQRREEGGGEKT